MELRPYQQNAINSLWEFWRENPVGGIPLIVAPTGSGKSFIIAEIVRRVVLARPDYRILVVTHRKEIIEQNAMELQKLLANELIGIWSAGLGKKQLRRITYGGIQSIYKTSPHINLLIIDECHLVGNSSDSMYQKFLDNILIENPSAKIIGLTATPYRLDQGNLIDINSIFTDIAYDISVRELIDDMYLSNILSRVATSVDLDGVRRSGYDFNQGELEGVFDPLTENHVDEIINKAEGRKHILVFCSSIKHAEHVANVLTEKGIKAAAIHSELFGMEREKRLNEFKRGEIRAITNVDVLTTGFNFPGIDCLVLLRVTESCGLYVQMIGRGMRRAEGKGNCLVLDFGGNIERHGPIDCISVKNKKGKRAEINTAPTKKCPECGCVIGIKGKICPSCDYNFPEASCRLDILASSRNILSEIEEKEIKDWKYKIHNKEGKPPSLRIDYIIGNINEVSDFLCFEHGGYATVMANKKWSDLGGKKPYPKNAGEALERMGELGEPASVKLRQDGKYKRIISMEMRKREAVEEIW